jgi:hypothetical protein
VDDLIKFIYPFDFRQIQGCRTLTLREVLFGYEDLPLFDANSSQGVRMRVWVLDKKKLLADDPETFAAFEAKMNAILESFKLGHFTYQICCDKLKDELRDLDRVSCKKTRIFNITDFVDNVLIKMFVGDLVSKTKFLMLVGSPACGVNPAGHLWGAWYRMFKGRDVVFSDVSGFDHTLTLAFSPILWTIFSRAYTCSWEATLAMWAYMSCIMALRFAHGKGRCLGRGNSSGNWITTWLNTIYNSIYFSLATVVIVKGKFDNEIAVSEILRQLYLKLYSDDNMVMNMSYDIKTNDYAVAFKALFGITLTDTDKSNIEGEKTYVIDDVEFLSRRFVNESGVVYCPLAVESILSQLYYVRVPRTGSLDALNSQTQINIDNVCRDVIELGNPGVDILLELNAFVVKNRLPYTINFSFINQRAAYKAANL